MQYVLIIHVKHLNTTLCIGSIDACIAGKINCVIFKYNTLYRFNKAYWGTVYVALQFKYNTLYRFNRQALNYGMFD